MLTVFTTCAKCNKEVTVHVGTNETVGNYYYCANCFTSGTTATTDLATIPVIKGFADYMDKNKEPVKTAEEKALDILKEFCVGV